jgi:hypothetical protein
MKREKPGWFVGNPFYRKGILLMVMELSDIWMGKKVFKQNKK